jgi:Lar family restriction alleviation protein
MEMLEKCPFCGGEAGYESTQRKYGIVHTVYCTCCGVEMTRLYSEAAIEAWNRRPEQYG